METIKYYTSAEYGAQYMGWNKYTPVTTWSHISSWLHSGHYIVFKGANGEKRIGPNDVQQIHPVHFDKAINHLR